MHEYLSTARVGSWLVLAVSGLLLLAGCGGATEPSAIGSEEARQTLEDALSSWQKGEPVEALKKASPSIVVSDETWTRGDKLMSFHIDGPPKASGAERTFRVTLWLTDGKGKQIKEIAEYAVGTGPVRTVFRSVFE
jgi:hypothetical protein